MFTGIIEEVGTVAELTTPPSGAGQTSRAGGPARRSLGEGGRLRIECQKLLPKLEVSSSIAVNGCCLTVTRREDSGFWCDLSPETLHRTGFRRLQVGAPVNLEAPLALNTPLGGHIVQGHVDGTGTLVGLPAAGLPADLSRVPQREAEAKAGDGNYWLDLDVPAELEHYLIEKGSVAVEGISLTVASIDGARLRAAIIPFTYENTNLRALQPGDPVNLECDLLAKYVEKLLLDRPLAPTKEGPATLSRRPPSKLTLKRLLDEGF